MCVLYVSMEYIKQRIVFGYLLECCEDLLYKENAHIISSNSSTFIIVIHVFI